MNARVMPGVSMSVATFEAAIDREPMEWLARTVAATMEDWWWPGDNVTLVRGNREMVGSRAVVREFVDLVSKSKPRLPSFVEVDGAPGRLVIGVFGRDLPYPTGPLPLSCEIEWTMVSGSPDSMPEPGPLLELFKDAVKATNADGGFVDAVGAGRTRWESGRGIRKGTGLAAWQGRLRGDTWATWVSPAAVARLGDMSRSMDDAPVYSTEVVRTQTGEGYIVLLSPTPYDVPEQARLAWLNFASSLLPE